MMMNKPVKKSRILGIAFLIQSVIPLIANLVFLTPLIKTDDVRQTLINLAGHPIELRVAVLAEMITALGIIFLGVVLYQYLRKENAVMALTGLGFYILEGVLLAISRSNGLLLLNIARDFVANGEPASLLPVAGMLMDSMNLNYTLEMLAFSTGAPLFYFLLYRSRLVPRWLSLWGLITVLCPCLVAIVGKLFGVSFPLWFYLPYMPFEPVIGFWILIKGLPPISGEPGVSFN
jgi:hypothetical protein